MQLHQALSILTSHDLKELRKLALLADRSTRKDLMVEALAGFLLTGDLALVWSDLDDLDLKAIAEAVHNWEGYFDVVRFRAKYGALPSYFRPRGYSFLRVEPPPRRTVLPLFFYQREIPEDLRPRLAKLVAQPAESPFLTLTDAELPQAIRSGGREAEPLRRLATEALVRHDLPAVLRLIGQGGVAVGAKTGLPGTAAVAKIEAILLGGDWYASTDDWKEERWTGGPIRPIRPFAWPVLLQAGGLAKQEGGKLALTARGKKALSEPIETVVSHLFERWQLKGAPDELRRVDLIKGQTSKGAKLTACNERRSVIASALRDCPVGCWISLDELFRQMQLLGHRFEVAQNSWGLYLVDAQYGGLGNQGYDGFEILQARYILVYLFEYLATLGLIDVAYTTPYHARLDYAGAWGADEFLFLSRYDGLRYIRLNALGAFCLGLAERYQPTLEARPPLLAIGADLGLTLLRGPEPGERLLLERIGRPLSADRWALDPEALLRHSADPEEYQRIRAFLESAGDKALPTEVRDLLESVGERATALTDGGPARLIRCRDASTAAMLAADPTTAPHCARAGERLICVAEPKLAAFRKGLARLGLVLPETLGG